ncbi:MAG TPA: hypothetical protein IAA22_04410, partial [Candidatus Olsenella stercoravium]|nr:hypothetical protein [Candidatus Olsenella stercoravium]
MASHFRSAERQGSEGEDLLQPVAPEAAPQVETLTAEDTGAFLAAADPTDDPVAASVPVMEAPEEVHVVTAAESEDASTAQPQV